MLAAVDWSTANQAAAPKVPIGHMAQCCCCMLVRENFTKALQQLVGYNEHCCQLCCILGHDIACSGQKWLNQDHAVHQYQWCALHLVGQCYSTLQVTC